jgi:hypothetical protein
MPSQARPTLLNRLQRSPRTKRLQSRTRRMCLLEHRQRLLEFVRVRRPVEGFEFLGHRFVEGGHTQAGKRQGDGLGEEREETALVDGVVEELSLEL